MSAPADLGGELASRLRAPIRPTSRRRITSRSPANSGRSRWGRDLTGVGEVTGGEPAGRLPQRPEADGDGPAQRHPDPADAGQTPSRSARRASALTCSWPRPGPATRAWRCRPAAPAPRCPARTRSNWAAVWAAASRLAPAGPASRGPLGSARAPAVPGLSPLVVTGGQSAWSLDRGPADCPPRTRRAGCGVRRPATRPSVTAPRRCPCKARASRCWWPGHGVGELSGRVGAPVEQDALAGTLAPAQLRPGPFGVDHGDAERVGVAPEGLDAVAQSPSRGRPDPPRRRGSCPRGRPGSRPAQGTR